ncbi:MAG: ribonuclease HIII [Planctomycetota bacterium]|jgi:ribonuclease HIII
MTRTIKMNSAQIQDLRNALNDARYSFKKLDHAHFQARDTGIVVSAYRSGKVVFQGARADELCESLGYGPAEAAAAPAALDTTLVGSDESGKGDYFGPLVVAAVTADPKTARELIEAGVKDCKKMTDAAILKVAASIRELCPHAVRAMSPVEYNAAHEAEGNVALFLARMHAEAIAKAVTKDATRAVIDQFTFPERLEAALREQGVELPVEVRPRAEDNIAVAAASVLARAEFLIGLKDLGTEHGYELPKGAGTPVDRAARDIFREGGIEELRAISKIHFRTTKKVTEHLF